MLPINKKEEILFGLMNVFGMAVVMMTYNLALNGTLFTMTPLTFISMFIITFIVAFIVESIVTPKAIKFAFSLPFDKSSKIKKIIAIASCIVPCMVLIMSAYGVLLMHFTSGIEDPIYLVYLKTVCMNFIVAYPLQLLIVGPTTRWILAKYIRPRSSK